MSKMYIQKRKGKKVPIQKYSYYIRKVEAHSKFDTENALIYWSDIYFELSVLIGISVSACPEYIHFK